MSHILPSALPPLSLYIHIPWCEKKCPYCDFNSHHSSKASIPEAQYIEHLKRDFVSQKNYLFDRPISSIFFGGGTPSLMSAQGIKALLDFIRQEAELSAHCEVTFEANPSSSEQEKFAGFIDAGVNRFSLGVQSFQSEKLEALGRVHNSDDVYRALEALRGFEGVRFNIDLMHGLPNQSEADALFDLNEAITQQARHISWYQLTIEQNTAFYSAPPLLPVEDVLETIQDQGFEALSQAGFTQYEVSAFAKSEADRSRHNLNYWQFGDYLAIGAGAHGKVTSVTGVQGQEALSVSRFNNTRLPQDYMSRQGDYLAKKHEVAHDEVLFEALMNVLRLKEGAPLAVIAARTGLDEVLIRQRVSGLMAEGLIEIDGVEGIKTLRCTAQGFRFLNIVLERLLLAD